MKNISIKYNLKYQEKEYSPITISISWEGNRYMTSTGIKVKTLTFDKQRGRLKNGNENTMQINQMLNILESSIKEFYITHKSLNKNVNLIEIKECLSKLLHPGKLKSETGNNPSNLLEAFSKFIISRSNHPNYKHGTVKHYKVVYHNLEKFCKFKNINLQYENLNADLISKFIEFQATKLNFLNSTIQKTLKTIKVFLNYCFENEMIPDENYKRIFKLTTSKYEFRNDTNQHILFETELKLLEDYIPEEPHLQATKDMFLTQVYTAIRYSDLKNIKSDNIDLENRIIRINQTKTRSRTDVPICNRLLAILKKYPNNILPIISNQKYNDNIKTLCRNAGINQNVEVVKYSLKKPIRQQFEKWELISSHSARAIFIVHSLRKGVLPKDIMNITGHSDFESFKGYMKIAQSDSIKRLREAWNE